MNTKIVAMLVIVFLWTATVGHTQTTRPESVASTAGEPLQQSFAPPTQSALTDNAPRGVAPDAPPIKLVREGTHLTNRTGRLSHSADGTATFTFDADGKTQQDPAMLILPNLKLQTMESVVLIQSKDAHFRVSGTVSEYKGRNYILLDKAVVVADIDQQM